MVVARRSCTENEQEMLVLMMLAVTTTTRLRVVAAAGTTTTSIGGGGGGGSGSGLGDDSMVSAVVRSEFEAAMKNEHENESKNGTKMKNGHH